MIVARRYETLSVHRVLQHFRTSDCEWLTPHSAGDTGRLRVSVTDSLKRRELLEDFLLWYFDSFLIPILRVSIRNGCLRQAVLMTICQTTFYVTESSAFRNRVLYFRHDDWRTLCAPLVEKLSSDTFQRIEQVRKGRLLHAGLRTKVLRRMATARSPRDPTTKTARILIRTTFT